MTDERQQRALYVIVCGAGPALRVGQLVALAQQRGWDVQLIATSAALNFIDVPRLEAQTTHAVRSEYRAPSEGHRASLPAAAAVIVAPATYNTINKWAHGASDTYALGILAESIGLGIPVVVLPFVNSALAAHFAFQRSVRDLRSAGVRVILGPGEWEPHPPGTGGDHLDSFPWHLALDAAEGAVAPGRRGG
jgi:phosphopantothenoylcysteine synthetase/decarboxylase